MAEQHEWLTIDEAADQTRRPRGTLYNWRSRNEGPPSYLVGGRVLYKRAEVLAWMESGRREPVSGADEDTALEATPVKDDLVVGVYDKVAKSGEPTLQTFEVAICSLCLDGVAGECHVPGCAFWMDDAPGPALARRLHRAALMRIVSTESKEKDA